MSSFHSDPDRGPSDLGALLSNSAVSERITDNDSDADDVVASQTHDNALLADDPLEQSSSTK